MVRSIWKRTLVTTFAWAGLAWAQQPITSSGPAEKPAQSPGQYFSVREPGKTGQKCKVIRSWKTPEGKTAYQVQALDTGEMMTIVETGEATNQSLYQAGNRLRVQAVASRIFHWGSDRRPPPGTPLPPIETVQTMPSAAPRPEVAKMASMAHPDPAKPPASAQSEPTKPLVPAHTESSKSTATLPWLSRTTETRVTQTQTALPPANTLPSAPMTYPMTQPKTTAQPNTTTTALGTANVREPSVPTAAPTSLPQTNSFSASSISQPKTAAPDYRLGSTPAAQPKVILQDTAMNQPKTAVQNKANSAPEKPSDALTPRASNFTPYFPTSPAVASPVTPQRAVSPERVVQVVPPSSEGTSFAKTTTSLAPAAPAPKSDVLRQAVSSVPGGNGTVPAASEKKPANMAKVSSGQPASPVPAPSSAPSTPTPASAVPAIPSPTASVPAATKPVTTVMQPSMGTAGNKPASVTAAPPTDWRQSWGQTDDGKAQTTEKPAQSSTDSKSAPAKSALPQADSKRPDPLQMPTQFDRRPLEEKPSAPKRDSMLLPSAAAPSTSTVKPAVTTVTEPVKTPVSSASIPVPLGAQSVIQAGDPGPGGVRYIPVPMVTMPDVRRAPVPPMMTPSQVYGTSGAVPAANEMQVNAFTPALSRQAVAQTSNAFGGTMPTVPAASSAQPMPAPAAAGMMAQAMHPAGSNNLTNPALITPVLPGVALASQTVPAAYQATNLQAQPLSMPLTAGKPTPERVQQMVVALRDSLYPSQREWAVENMSAVDWRAHPQVVQALMTAAKEDPAPTVRASCVRCLANMKVNTMPVYSAVRDLKNDTDSRVRQEAERAMSVLTVTEK
jgi:hypothetical protein